VNEAVKTGLTGGIAIVAMMAGAMFIPNGSITAFFQYGSFILFLASVFVGIKRTRDRELDGVMEFKQGLKAGVTTGLIAAILISTYQYIGWTTMDVPANIAEMKKAGVEDSDVRMILHNMNNANFAKGAMFLAITNVIIAFLTSLAVTLLLRKKSGLLGQQ
jgi:hypothetical protein